MIVFFLIILYVFMMEEIIWEVYDVSIIKVVYWVFVVFLVVNGVKEY